MFTESVTGLTPGASYSYVAFATNSVRDHLHQPGIDLLHLGGAPTVTTPTSASITSEHGQPGRRRDQRRRGRHHHARRAVCADVGERQPDAQRRRRHRSGRRRHTTGVFTESVSGLTPGGNYSFVAFATNSVGTTYTSPASTFTSWPCSDRDDADFRVDHHQHGQPRRRRDEHRRGGHHQLWRGVRDDVGEPQPDPRRYGRHPNHDIRCHPGVFTESVTGLTAGISYSYVAFATNSGGPPTPVPSSTFTTLAATAPR